VVDEAVLDAGRTVNVKLKQQAGTAASSYDYVDTRIKAIRRADALPGGFDVNNSDNIISSDDSANKIYSWFDDSDRDNNGEGDGAIYYYSEASKIKGGYDMVGIFGRMQELADISGVTNLDVSGTGYMHSLFYNDRKLADISPLSGWDTSSCVSLSGVFSGASSLEDIAPIAYWNTSKVKDLRQLFYETSITSVDALETKQYPGRDYVSWNVSNVKDMSAVFDECSRLSDISKLSTWDVSSATDMTRLFYRDYSLSSLAPIFGWMSDSSAVTMTEIFDGVPVAVARPDWYHE
jgi:hypothetical protein